MIYLAPLAIPILLVVVAIIVSLSQELAVTMEQQQVTITITIKALLIIELHTHKKRLTSQKFSSDFGQSPLPTGRSAGDFSVRHAWRFT